MSSIRESFDSAASFLAARPDIRCVDLLLPDMNGILRGKRVEVGDLRQVYEKGLLLPGSMFALDALGGTVESTGLGFDEGDADRPCLPVADGLHVCPWLGSEVAQLQVQMFEHDGSPFFGDPRHLVGAMMERFRARGLNPVVAVELEFYFVDRERTPEGNAQPPRSPLTGRREHRTQINSMIDLDSISPILREIVDTCREQGVPAGTALSEYGPSQWEVNLAHVADAQLACDHAIRLKRIVKGVGLSHGLEATFMAKPYRDMAGSGMHVHVSLLDESGRNAFASDGETDNPLLRQSAAGLLATMADCMALFAPNANSYRRLRPEAYVPLHPTWAYNNRGVAVRVPLSAAADRRLEHRVAGADANPYLFVAAVLAGMFHGMERRLEAPPPLTGNAYTQPLDAPRLPNDWAAAIAQFDQSKVMREYLGGKFVDLYCNLKHGELEDFASYVSPLEYSWYLAPL
jgi:glutamine synthetase